MFLDRFLFPLIFQGKFFPFSKFDRDSQTGDNFNIMIVLDKYEEIVLKKLFKNKEIYLAQHPSYGSCFCDKISIENKPVLSPLSVFGDIAELSEYYSKILLRDTLNALKELNSNEIHFRHHPDYKSEWIYNFMFLLNNKNIKTKLLDSELPIRDIICNYKAFIGLTSSSLKDARASCNNCIVVGFEAASQFRYLNPKFLFGHSDGIDWIDVEGKYNKMIFNKKKYINSAKNSIPDILNKL